ncbi:Asp-tRNA(Asn)/Glu-tRNA(Gln) amidotransferase subunit GatA [Arcanobacterium phocisimile]|uniref:Glutamyl-tRNA(Gln) amidotransferase subunit A n=1 Tax=Arcanobacterium phocisimile TaxID=1302235 RepID=A0ABX7IHZ4_9ACTO|nr:Asp-tRNA(Asn)/Glu-tRNA(Gln) amidotransferase subunit GatA [Arcanobacterium phocisimile]QRV02582.1 Asp-tRNA(Asn)/Glu-tRNA(Gln) amidotransferase subunit GatA [Arcanobacterium phocisimile]
MTEQLHKKSAWELAQLLQAGEVTSVALTELFLDRIEKLNPKMNVFLAVDAQGALEEARTVDADRTAGKELPFFAGVPVALKDNMCQRGIPTTAASKMLEGWLPPYDATVVRLLKEARLPILGHTNMDEFAMGSSTEHSAFGPTQNPWGKDLIPGGSGGGSAAAVAGYLAPWALGSDTGGSIRQPGAMTGTVGTKPTYGAVSRYGIIALASSLDQVGPVARDVRDAAALQEIISKHDPLDSTSLTNDFSNLVAAVNEGKELHDLSDVTFGIVKELDGEGFNAGVLETYHGIIDKLKAAGANFVEVSCPSFDYAMSAYYLIMPAEMSSNLARYDGVRFGNRVLPKEGPVTAETMMAATREAGFGPEVKRRLILGTYALSAGTYDAYYGSAQRVRTLVQRDLKAAYEKVDVLLTPATPTVAFKFGEKLDDPIAMYKNDMTTIPANLAGTPAMTIPVGLSEGLPVGIQIMAPTFEDARMYKVAAMVENVADPAASHPAMDMWED